MSHRALTPIMDQQFVLRIQFDREQVDCDKVEEETRKILSARLSSVRLEVGTAKNGHPLLAVLGPLEEVDACHIEISRILIDKLQWRHFRLIDDAGDELRKRAYPMLAEIEQDFRAFINQCLIETQGFSWWTSLGDVEFGKLEGKEGGSRAAQHPLELTTFDELINIVLREVSVWPEDRPLQQQDLLQLLSESATLDELRSNLRKRIEKFSFWNNVFARYFDDQQQWSEAQKELRAVIELRNRVMHHRPVHIGDLEMLRNRKNRLSAIISSAKGQLSDQERTDIQKQTSTLRQIYSAIVREAVAEDPEDALWRAIYTSNTAEGLQEVVTQIDSAADTHAITLKQALRLEVDAFSRMQDVTKDDPVEAVTHILGSLLPKCLLDEPDAAVELHLLRQCLANWLRQYREPSRTELQSKVLDTLQRLLESPDARSACYTVSQIGYKTTGLPAILWRIVDRQSGEIGDVALSTLAWLGVSDDDTTRALADINQRAQERFSHALVMALARLGDAAGIDIVLQRWMAPTQRMAKKVDSSLAFTTIREILDRHYDDARLQDEAWQRVTSLVTNEPDDLYGSFDIGHISHRCNSPHVVPTLLQWMARVAEGRSTSQWARYIIGQRLEDCVAPRQLEGWSASFDINAIDLLEKDASIDTKSDVLGSTQTSWVKKEAWEILLRTGRSETLSVLRSALEDESGRNVQREIMELVACLQVSPLPKLVTQLVIERYDQPESDRDGREIFRRLAATQLTCSAGNKEAFDTLLGFGLTHAGQVVTDSSEALGELGRFLVSRADESVVRDLVQVLVSSPDAYRRIAAASALELIANSVGSAVEVYTEQLAALPHDDQRAPIERGLILQVFGYFANWQLPDSWVSDLVSWAANPDRWLSTASFFVLTNHGKLSQQRALLTDVLHLHQIGDTWGLDDTEELLEWAPFAIGHLYSKDPVAFTPAVVKLLGNPNWRSVAQIMRWLGITHAGIGVKPLPQAVVDALLSRVRDRQSPMYSENDVLRLLEFVAPTALASEPWHAVMNNWSPDARETLAIALGQLDLGDARPVNVVFCLELLAMDSFFAVRRAAFRGLARQAMAVLKELCQSWIMNTSAELVEKAAEACCWLDDGDHIGDTTGFHAVYSRLAIHPDQNVREAAKRSWESRRALRWADTYLAKVTNVKDGSNDEILKAWCFGEALAHLGDDESVRQLEEHAANAIYSPNHKYWLKHLIGKTKENWKKTTGQWPEPWQTMPGTIEEGNGWFTASGHPDIQVKYTLWYQPASSPFEKHTWGGYIFAEGLLLNRSRGVLKLADGRQSEIYFPVSIGQEANFLGMGLYPRKNAEIQPAGNA